MGLGLRRARFGLVIACVGTLSCEGKGPATPAAPAAPATPATPEAPAVPAAPVDVQLLAINDFHGHLQPPDGLSGSILNGNEDVACGGATHLAAWIDALRADNPNTLVVSAGDLVGGSPLVSAMFHDEPTIEVMNTIGLDINAVGNHEFDEGWDEVRRLQNGGCHPQDGCREGQPFGGATFRFLAANVRVDAEKATLFPAVDVRTLGGVRIAFIGMTLEGTPEIVHPRATQGLTFDDEVQTVAALVPGLQAQGIEAIVVLIHEGGQGTGGLQSCGELSGPIETIARDLDPAIDVVVTGHTHQAYICEVAGKLVTSAGSFGRLVTDIDLKIDPATGDVLSAQAHNILVRRDRERPDITEQVAGYAAQAGTVVDRRVGTIAADLDQKTNREGRSVLGTVIADAQVAAMAEQGAQVAFMNNGGIRASLEFDAAQGEPEDGIVTYGEAFAVHPFGNRLLAQTITGAQLQTLLQHQFDEGNHLLQSSSSLSYRAADGKVPQDSIRIDGKPVGATDPVRIVTNDFIASGKDGFETLALGTDRIDGPIDVDALCDYLAAHPTLKPPQLTNVSVR